MEYWKWETNLFFTALLLKHNGRGVSKGGGGAHCTEIDFALSFGGGGGGGPIATHFLAEQKAEARRITTRIVTNAVLKLTINNLFQIYFN